MAILNRLAAAAGAGLVEFARSGAKTASAPAGEQGYSGVASQAGKVSGDELDRVSAWNLPTRWETIDKMLADPDVASAVNAIRLPILAAPLRVEPGDDTPKAREVAEFIEQGLDNMSVDLQQHRSEALDACAWGNRVFETVYERREGSKLWHLRKLALRPSESIEDWLVDEETGGPKGVKQVDDKGKARSMDMDRLLVFTYDQKGGSLLGNPAIRPAYGPWLLKTELAKIGAVAADRHALGIPWALYRGGNTTAYQRMAAALASIRAHAKAYLLMTDLESASDWGIKGVEGAVVDPVPQIELHRRAIHQAIGTQFLLLGGENVGSLALSEDQTSFFLMSLEAYARAIEGAYSRYLIPRWCSYNWTLKKDQLPRIKHGTIARRDAEKWLGALKIAMEAGLLIDRDIASEAARDLLRLASPEPATIPGPAGEAPPATQDGTAPDATPASDGPAGAPSSPATFASAPPLASVSKMQALGLAPDFVTMAGALDKADARLLERLGALQKTASAFVVRRTVEALEKGDIAALADLRLSTDKEEQVILAELEALYRAGASGAGREMDEWNDRAGALEPDKEAFGLLGALAVVVAARLADRLVQAATAAAVDQAATGRIDRARLAEMIAAAPASLLQSLISRATTSALAIGRRAEIVARGGKRVIYTAVMDRGTCETCREDDGKEFDPTGPDAIPIPNPGCLGGNRCRCTWVPAPPKRP